MLKMVNLVGRIGLGLVLMLGVLAGCGDTATAVAPDVRVENMMSDLNAAFNDANIKDSAKQEEWATKISQYFVPESQASQKASLLESLQEMSGGDFPTGAISIEGVDAEVVSEDGDTATVTLKSGKMVLNVPELGGRQEIDLADTEFLGSNTENATMRKIDGVWYIEE